MKTELEGVFRSGKNGAGKCPALATGVLSSLSWHE
jgi:hypothetical protein